MPKTCRCGEEAVIKTSGTAKNLGGSSIVVHMDPKSVVFVKDKYHLFKWTDESMVEEIKDINVMLSDVKGDISYLKGEVVGLKKKLEGMKKVIVELEKDRIDCINELKSMKNM
ncbi:uncharacterized protein At4g04775-like [Brassica napus]|uniref:uncharacterized protein At4g04775-like n=1 Tax=Brassica napus TaxID=3708 RepID=UPI00207A55B7|nr:uncharacterized protein At4g04775-like [Brassica napus]